MVGTAGLELEALWWRPKPPAEILSAAKDLYHGKLGEEWWALQDSNLRPRACEARALTS